MISKTARMAAVLVAGGPGAGKSSVARLLYERGYRSVDLDFGPARFEDADGNVVGFPQDPDAAWLRDHHWVWVPERLEWMLDRCRQQSAVLCGTSQNMWGYLRRFELVIFLSIGPETMLRRLGDPARDNDFGRVGGTVRWSLDWLPDLERDMISSGATCIDADRRLDDVVDNILAICGDHGIDVTERQEPRYPTTWWLDRR